mgnify:CR=1 FL=1
MFSIILTSDAEDDLSDLAKDRSKARIYKAVSKAIRLLQANPRHPGLKTHKFTSKQGPNGEDVFEAYAQNNTPGAYRVFWYYGPKKKEITVFAITPHP